MTTELPDYEYRGLMADSWDLLRGDTSQWADRFFYLEVIKESGQPVLDVGCGTGRLLLDYLAQEIDVEGVDNSPEMLERLREIAVSAGLKPAVYQAEMETLSLPRRYKTILVPSSSFQLVIDPAAAQEALRRFYEHLEPGGTLALPFFFIPKAPEVEGDVQTEEWRLVGEKVRPQDGLLLRYWGRSTYDFTNQLEHTESRYELLRDGEVIYSEEHRRSPADRWYSQAQVRERLEEAGFVGLRFYHEFTRQPARPDDTLFTVLAERPRERDRTPSIPAPGRRRPKPAALSPGGRQARA